MKLQFANDLAVLFRRLEASNMGAFTESFETLRVDSATNYSEDIISEIKRLNTQALNEGFGCFELYGEVADEVDIEKLKLEDIQGDLLTVVFEKKVENTSLCFLTLKGFEAWLRGESFGAEGDQAKKCIRVLGEDNPFSTHLFSLKIFDTDDSVLDSILLPERPWKLVRDLTRVHTPQSIAPWLVEIPPVKEGPAFVVWKTVAKEKLAFCLPSEIRQDGDREKVVFRGGRSIPIAIDTIIEWSAISYDAVHQACDWIYSSPRESETKFQLLNNHIATNWSGTGGWPSSANDLLPNSLAGAKEAFAFHLQDQSKEAVKALGDLRKGLQEEVSKTQSATRDLISAIWRDFAVAGLVLALRAPISPIGVSDSAIKLLYIGVSILLSISLVVGTFSVLRFNYLADVSRRDWRNKLYNFMSSEDWKKLVENPISAGRCVYWLSWFVCFLVYALFIRYFLSLVIPAVVETYIDNPVFFVVDFLSCIASAVFSVQIWPSM